MLTVAFANDFLLEKDRATVVAKVRILRLVTDPVRIGHDGVEGKLVGQCRTQSDENNEKNTVASHWLRSRASELTESLPRWPPR